MKMRKWWILVLALVLCLGALGITAAATEQETPALFHADIPFQVNPVYKDLYSEEELSALLQERLEEQLEESGSVSHQQPTVQVNEADYLTVEQAGLQLRQKMKKRETYIEVLVTSTNVDYNAVVAEVVNAALVHTGVPDEGDYLLWHFGGWEGEVFREQSGNQYLYRYELLMIYYTSNSQEKELDAAVDNLLYSLDLDGKSDYQKVCAVYDYICSNITYDFTHLDVPSYTLKNSAYAALMNNTAICQGYANLFYRLCLEMGIDNRIIAGDTVGGGHAWNIVKLGDVYYNADSTWDADANTRDYFLKNSEGFADHLRYIEYATTQFHMDYPMSATDYVDGVAGVPENVYVAGICGEDAYWTLGRDRVLTILGSGATYDYKDTTDLEKRPEWEYWDGSFDTVVVEAGITDLGDYLFRGEDDLKKLSLPEGLLTIGKYTFQKCIALTEIVLPESLTETGEYCFSGCSAVTNLVIPQNVVLTLGKGSFNACTALTEVTVPVGVTGVRDIFTNCTALETAHIHSKNLGKDTFYKCTALGDVYLYDTVEQIRVGMFTQCQALTSITIPASVTVVENNAFLDSRSLTEIRFLGDAPQFGEYTFNNLCYNGDVFVYYPCSNATWTQELMETAGSSFGRKEVSWIAGVHNYETSVKDADCIHDAMTVKTCADCGDTVEFWLQYATGQHTYDGDQDTTCQVCGSTRDLNMPTTPMYRLYNKNSGEHFYTGSVEERNNLIEAGWQYEGIAWNAPTKSGAPVYRLYNPNNGDHHYTMSADERDMLVEVGWQYEGVAWNSASPSNLPMYRLYNPNADCGSHHYTGSEEERDYLVSLGWHYEGIGWYGMLK